MPKINRVLIAAGIHGNETTGIFLVKKFKRFPNLITRSSLKTETILANPQAIELGKRYVDVDLNRCFSPQVLNQPQPNQYEAKLAQKIYQQIIASRIDFIIDLHTTTSNMGLTLLLSSDRPFNLRLAAFLAANNPEVKIVYTTHNIEKNRLRNICPLGLTIEIGAVAHQVIDPVLFAKTERLIFDSLDYLENNNRGLTLPSTDTATVYFLNQTIDFPRDSDGAIAGIVHPQLHGNDYSVLNPGDPMFIMFDNTTIYYRGKTTVYPIFINESAYWEKKIAMCLTTKKQVVIS